MIKTVLCFLLFAPALCFAQVTTIDNARGAAKEYYEKADHHYAFGRLEMADSFLHLAVKEKDNFIDAWILMGQINLQFLKHFDVAAKAYEKVKLLKSDYLSDVEFQLAQCYMNQGQYAKARTAFQAFLAQSRINGQSRLLSEKMLKDCDFAEKAMQNPVKMKPVNLGPGVNTAEDESMPSLTADGKYLYFTRHFGTGQFQDEDIYVAINSSAGFTKANSAGETVNTEEYIEGAQSIAPSGKYLFFTSADRRDGVGRADIYMSRKTGDMWERPNNIGNPVNSPGWDAQPCISADGRTLFFASVRGTGKGGSDIWYSNLTENGTWSEPQNLGNAINTQYDEMRPFLHPDGNTLYFSSNGWPGMGNYDLFVVRRDAAGNWGTPENLGYPINTPGDEVGIYVSTDGGTAYYASEQTDSYGQMDIYSFEMPETGRPAFTSYIKGNVFDNDNRDPLYATIQIYDLSTGKLYSSLSTDRVNGNFLSTLPAGKDYAVEVMKDGYLFYSHNISLKDVKGGVPFELNIPLRRIKVGEKVVLNNVFFESEKFELKKESKAELDVIMKMIEKNPSLKIEIGGHTDNTGTDEKNKALSENRAKSVYQYLIEKGISADRLSYKGYSSTQPVAGNDTPENKAKNRRTEFTVTAI
jgi:outer membrane protein OmpA-like peptidoglycan-associated protein/tetratricopeptide (TPR) repeat protein